MDNKDDDDPQTDTGSDQVQKCDICNEKFSDGYCADCEAYMCQTCFDRHLRTRPCRHHVLAEDIEHEIEVTKTHSEPCMSHENMVIEFYCVDHKKVGCAKCMLLEHSACLRQDINAAAKQFQENGEDIRLSEKIKQVESIHTDCMQWAQQLTQTVAAANDTTVNAVEAFNASVSESVDETARVALEKAEHLRLENETQIERLSDILTKIGNSLGLSKDRLKNTNQLEKVFIVAMDIEPKLAEFQETLLTLKTDNTTTEYEFHPRKIILDLINDSRLLGEVLKEPEELDTYIGQLEQMEMKYDDERKKTHSLEQQLQERDEQITLMSSRQDAYIGKLEQMEMKYNDERKKTHSLELQLLERDEQITLMSSRQGEVLNSSSLATQIQTKPSKMDIAMEAYISPWKLLFAPSKIGTQELDVPFDFGIQIEADITRKGIFQTHGITVMVYKASILRLNVDCIVSASNSRLQHGGGVARIISGAAGEELERECTRYIRANSMVPVGQVCSTTAGNLHYKKVIHAVGPTWYDYDKTKQGRRECEDTLMETITNCFLEAERIGMRSIALPAISSAIFGVPIKICVNQYARAIHEYFSQKKSGVKSTLSEVHFIDVNENTVHAIQTAFIKAFGTVRFEDI